MRRTDRVGFGIEFQWRVHATIREILATAEQYLSTFDRQCVLYRSTASRTRSLEALPGQLHQSLASQDGARTTEVHCPSDVTWRASRQNRHSAGDIGLVHRRMVHRCGGGKWRGQNKASGTRRTSKKVMVRQGMRSVMLRQRLSVVHSSQRAGAKTT